MGIIKMKNKKYNKNRRKRDIKELKGIGKLHTKLIP